jgi:hypothetical protein
MGDNKDAEILPECVIRKNVLAGSADDKDAGGTTTQQALRPMIVDNGTHTLMFPIFYLTVSI